ncbi:MAG: DUF6798 domain-containing protein [Polyangiaceae bacterium]
MTKFDTKKGENDARSRRDLVSFSLAATLALAIPGGVYRYFEEDQWGFLAALHRLKDPTFAPRDLYVDAYAGPSIRRFSLLVADVATKGLSQAAAFLVLYLSAGTLIGYGAGRSARTLFPSVRNVDVVAAALVLGVQGSSYGANGGLVRKAFIAHEAGAAWVMVALASILDGRLVPFVVSGVIAMLLHPQIGAEMTGLLFLGIGAVILDARRNRGPAPPFDPRRTLLAGLLFLLAVFLAFGPIFNRGPLLEGRTFVTIVAEIRNPHHMTPGNPFARWDVALWLLGGSSTFFLARQVTSMPRGPFVVFAATYFGILVTMVAGWGLTEILHVRLGPTLQAARLMAFANAITFIMCAGVVGALVAGPRRSGWVASTIGILVCLAPSLRIQETPSGVLAVLLLAAGTCAIRSEASTVRRCGGIAILTSLLVFGRALAGGEWTSRAFHARLDEEKRDIANFLLGSTPRDALVLTPPGWSDVRACSGRSIVVDFKSFPYVDSSMAEWWSRLKTVYGIRNERGFAIPPAANLNYARLTEGQWTALHAQYGFDFAIVPRQRVAAHPVVFQTRTLQVVAFGPRDGRVRQPGEPPVEDGPLYCER